MRHHRVLWMAIVFSTVIYAAIAYLLGPAPQGSWEAALRQPMVMTFYAVALFWFVMAMIVPRMVIRSDRLRPIVALAMFELCAVLGLLPALLYKDWRLFIAPWVLSLIGFARAWPQADVSARAS